MLKKFRCRPGAYVEIVPLGLLCTLQYNGAGILQKIILGFNYLNHRDEDVLDPTLTIELKKANIVPQRISFLKGTTWIRGVFYTKQLFKDEGMLPDCLKDSMIKDLSANMKSYTFYAGDIKNDSFNIAGAGAVSTRLSTLGFQILPGYQVYDQVHNLPIENLMKTRKSPFTFPLISGIMICESASDFRYEPADLNQWIVTDTTNYIDQNGYIHTKITSKQGTIDKSYTDIVQYDVQNKSIIILDDDKIVHSRVQSTFMRNRLSRNIHCSTCGKALVVPVKGFASCDDPHCVSRLYPNIQHFIRTLELPAMTFEEFQMHVKSKDITCVIDILLLDKYKDLKINCTLSKLLTAMVPVSVVRSADFFPQFTNYLGSVEALDYYLQNPDTIVKDLNLNKIHANGFCNWLKDPSNLVELEALLHADQINIQVITKKFEGSPIFRNKTICIVGKFKRGTLEDIISILQSYSAKVVTKFDNTVNCVLLGYFENENQEVTELATSYNIPIYGEDDFFKAYEIDLDIKKQRDALNHYLN